MRRKISKQQWLAYAFLLLLVLAAVAGVLEPEHDVYHGARRLSGVVESSGMIQGACLSIGLRDRRLADLPHLRGMVTCR